MPAQLHESLYYDGIHFFQQQGDRGVRQWRSAHFSSREYIYAAGALVSKITSSATIITTKTISQSAGNEHEWQYCRANGHYPFGGTWYNAASDKLLFTSYERDAESGNDYALARYYISRLGRFNSPDPVMAARPTAVVESVFLCVNDPINLNDPGENIVNRMTSPMTSTGRGGASQDECRIREVHE